MNLSIELAHFRDKYPVSLFARHMEEIFETAVAAGESNATDLTILIGHDNAISMISGSDWPLDSLALDRGAKSAYRVTGSSNGRIRVEGRDGLRHGWMESPTPAAAARLLLGS